MTINLAAAFAFSNLNSAKYCKVLFCRQANTVCEGIASQDNFCLSNFYRKYCFFLAQGTNLKRTAIPGDIPILNDTKV